MENAIAALVAVMTLTVASQGDVARYNFTAAWPSKVSIDSLAVDSSAPGLLASGAYKLDLEVVNQRLIGRLHLGNNVVESIPFSIQGCEKVKTPKWAGRATARGLPPGPGSNTRRVELRIVSADTRGCAISGTFTAPSGTLPGGKPNPGGPDQFSASAMLPDLTIRDATQDPDDPTKIRVEVYNNGPGAAKPTQLKLSYTKDAKVTTAQAAVPALNAKASAWIAVGVGLPIAAADGVTAQVDDPNKLSETNELNNAFKFK